MTHYAVLIGRIRQERVDLEKMVDRAAELMDKAERTGDDGYLDGVALNLHGFYTGVERIFEDIARCVDQEIPDGADWHKRLLLQMTAEIPDIRPAVLDPDTRLCLEEYRAFRHVVRNVYTFNLKMPRMVELVRALQACCDMLFRDLEAFGAFLRELE